MTRDLTRDLTRDPPRLQLVVFALVALAAAEKLDNLEKKEPIAIVRMDSTANEDGSFQYAYETANQIQVRTPQLNTDRTPQHGPHGEARSASAIVRPRRIE